MNFLGMGPGELLLILILALLIFGPGKLPELGRTIGKSLREITQMSHQFMQEWEAAAREEEKKKASSKAKEIAPKGQAQEQTKLPGQPEEGSGFQGPKAES